MAHPSVFAKRFKSYTVLLFDRNNTLLENIQLDIDASAYSFAYRNISDQLSRIGFQNFPSFKLNLSDVPASALIDTTNKEATRGYTEKFKKYGFYLKLDGKDGYLILRMK